MAQRERVANNSGEKISALRPRVVRKATATKHYNSDMAKARCHAMQGRMLDATLLDSSDPSKLRVLHFAGQDAQDTKVVYLARNLLPQNLVSLERDAKIANDIRELGLEIEVIRAELKGYVDRHVRQRSALDFDVVSLDFNGSITASTVRTVQDMLRISSQDEMIVHCANAMMRGDATTNIEYFVGQGLKDILYGSEKGMYPKGAIVVDPYTLASASRKLETVYTDEKYDICERVPYYPYVVLTALLPRPSNEYTKLARFLYASDLKGFEEGLIGDLARIDAGVVGKIKTLRELLQSPLATVPELLVHLDSLFLSRLGRKLDDAGAGRFALPNVIAALFDAASDSLPFFPMRSDHYSYVSETDWLMCGSIFHISRSHEISGAARDLAELMGFPKRFRIENGGQFREVYARYVLLLNEQNAFYDGMMRPEFLGGEAMPELTEDRVHMLLDQNLILPEDERINIEDIISMHRQWRGKKGERKREQLNSWLRNWIRKQKDARNQEGESMIPMQVHPAPSEESVRASNAMRELRRIDEERKY